MRIRNINWDSFKLTWVETLVLGTVIFIVGDEISGSKVHKYVTGKPGNTAPRSIPSNEIDTAPIPFLADTNTELIQEQTETLTEENELEDK